MLSLLQRQGFLQIHVQRSFFDVVLFQGNRISRKEKQDARINSCRNWDRKRLDRRGIYYWIFSHFWSIISR